MAAPVSRRRIESLSDLIFGLALSIGALALFANPTAGPPSDPGVVIADLLAFFYTFVMLIMIWIRYTGVVEFLSVESPRALRLNIAMLFLVAIEPYLFNQIFGVNHQDWLSAFGLFVTSLFALDFGALLAILAAFSHLALRQTVSNVPDARRRILLSQRTSQTVGAAFFLVSALPPFGTWTVSGTSVRLFLWLVPLFLIGVWRRGPTLKEWFGRVRGGASPEGPASASDPRDDAPPR